MSFAPKDPRKAARERAEWRRRSVEKYEENRRKRLAEDPAARKKAKLKKRGVMEVHKDDPDKYGELFLRVRDMPCFGRRFLPGHECGLGYAPASAHHIGDKDSEGMVPVCGKLHDLCHDQPWKVREALAEAGVSTLEALAKWYVKRAKEDRLFF